MRELKSKVQSRLTAQDKGSRVRGSGSGWEGTMKVGVRGISVQRFGSGDQGLTGFRMA